MNFSRSQIIQTLINVRNYSRYLEVGVHKGETFLNIDAEKKVAVDIKFSFDYQNDKNPNATYYQVPSDQYFSSPAGRDKFDIIFIDGLHTLEQTLRDLLNAVTSLADGGIIVIDDVIPDSYHASLPDFQQSLRLRNHLGSTSRSWMGDVYRVVFFIHYFLPKFNYATVTDSHGVLVMWQDPRRNTFEPKMSLEDIGRVPFEAIVDNERIYNKLPFEAVLRQIANAK
ncbi:class I SAM-dependent methyltransferase [Pseudodesulfovibrio indicus]|uniref:class I SAM-dependent methyltransferase n=1 Tax=Pseudodesulfovibrio indicus TaxID=1716143 RepID=UPI002931DD34|nr:class I SAM-dependent methyltransferase [Pseudodesulfovibrio indicus]